MAESTAYDYDKPETPMNPPRARCLWMGGLKYALTLLALASTVRAAEPPSAPIFRIEPDMHTAQIKRIATDAQGRWLVTASDDKTARVWDLASGRLLNVLRPPYGLGGEGRLDAVALSPDGDIVALGGWTQFNDGKNSLAADGMQIFLMERATGRLLRRIGGLPDVVNDLIFSPDGRYLVGTLFGNNGVRVWQADTGVLIGQDSAYGGPSNSADFSRDGRLITSSYDGQIRLYSIDADGLRRVGSAVTPGGQRPYAVRFSPDGTRIAVGFSDTRAVNVLDGSKLNFRYAPDTKGVGNGYLSSVAWSSDGQTLFAGGTYAIGRTAQIRHWGMEGQGSPKDEAAASNTVRDLRTLPGGGLVFSSADPGWGTLDAQGQRSRFVRSSITDLRYNSEGFRLSYDGRIARFDFLYGGKFPARFDLERGLAMGDVANVPLAAPRTNSPGLEVKGWEDGTAPTLNGVSLALYQYEISRSLAIAPDDQSFALGTEWHLRLFGRDGRKRWEVLVPSTAWGVNISGDGRTVVAALGDGTIRWYDFADGREKLAFFPHADKTRWVAWTPSGYYAASPGGDVLIGWHLNNSKDAAADFFPASRFKSRFNRPDVVARAIEAPSESEALRLADADAGRRAEQMMAIQAVLPPVVEILYPKAGTRVSSNTLTLHYVTRSPTDAPVTTVRARVNGQAVNLDNRNLVVQTAENQRSITVPIPSADAEIQLFAENKNGVSTPATLSLTWAGQKPAEESVFKPKLYVLAVGVSRYANPNYNLGLAAKDAQDIAALLQAQKGKLYADVQVRLLTDAKATRDDVVDGLDWLKKQVTARDVGMMFLAGHGVNDNTGKYYFMPHNGDPDKLLRTGVPQTDIRDTLNSLAGKAVFFVDSCHSGNALGTAKTRSMTAVTDAFVNELAAAENGVVVFTAATGKQLSQEDEKWGNGAFTKAVVEGLAGRADFKNSGRVTHKALDLYVSERVKELTGGAQSPVSIAPQGVTDFPLAVIAK